MYTIAISNSKGGTGKTTTARELAFILAKSYRILLIDLDPQASLTNSVTLSTAPTLSMAQVLNGKATLEQVTIAVKTRLDLAPADIELSASEKILREKVSAPYVLQKALKQIAHKYDFAIIDTVGANNPTVINALVAADSLIIPTRPESTDLKALVQFLELVNEVKELPASNLVRVGILPTQYVAQTSHHVDALSAIKKIHPKVFTPIGRTIKVSEAMTERLPLHEFEKDSPRALEYAQVTKEMVEWLKQ